MLNLTRPTLRDAVPRRPQAHPPARAARRGGRDRPGARSSRARTACRWTSTRTAPRFGEPEQSGMIFVDGVDIGDVADVALRDRRMLSADGIFVVVATISEQTGESVADPEVIFRGVPYRDDADKLLDEMRDAVDDSLERAAKDQIARDRPAPADPARRPGGAGVRAAEAAADGVAGRCGSLTHAGLAWALALGGGRTSIGSSGAGAPELPAGLPWGGAPADGPGAGQRGLARVAVAGMCRGGVMSSRVRRDGAGASASGRSPAARPWWLRRRRRRSGRRSTTRGSRRGGCSRAGPVHELRAEPGVLRHRRGDRALADRRDAVRAHLGRHRVLVRPGTLTDRRWPVLMQAAQGTGFGWAPYYERRGHRRPAAAADRRRPALPVGALPRQRLRAAVRRRARHGRLRLQRRRRHAGQGLRHDRPLDAGARAAARRSTARASTSTCGSSRASGAARGSRRSTAGTSTCPTSPNEDADRRPGRRVLRDLARATGSPATPYGASQLPGPRPRAGGRTASRACRPPARPGSSSRPTTSGARAPRSRARRAAARRRRWARCARGATARWGRQLPRRPARRAAARAPRPDRRATRAESPPRAPCAVRGAAQDAPDRGGAPASGGLAWRRCSRRAWSRDAGWCRRPRRRRRSAPRSTTRGSRRPGRSRARTRSRTTRRPAASTPPTSRPCARRSPRCRTRTSRVGIASWFGRGKATDGHWPALMQAAQGTGFAWAPYYEPEGVSDPSPQQIADDLHYLWTTYRGTRLRAAVPQRQGHGRLRLQRRRPDHGQGLRHREPLEPGARAAAATSTARASTST